MPPEPRSRFAPSPTGLLHLGHAFSALTVHSRAPNGFLLRIEDLDRARCRADHEAAICEDLAWLGLRWPEPLRQSERAGVYAAAISRLAAQGLCYPCSCTRGDILQALSAPQEGAVLDGPVYPGTCRARSMDHAAPGDAIRLNLRLAVRLLPPGIGFQETGVHAGWHRLDAERLLALTGDVVLARRGGDTAYHLAVVVDDAAQAITEVVRGLDLFEATFLHRVLQVVLGLPAPLYHHHRLIRDEAGKRLAKRDDARSLRRYRADGATPQDIRALLGLGCSTPDTRLPLR